MKKLIIAVVFALTGVGSVNAQVEDRVVFSSFEYIGEMQNKLGFIFISDAAYLRDVVSEVVQIEPTAFIS